MSVGRKWGLPWLFGLMMMYLLAGCGSDPAFDDGTSGGDSASLQVTVEPADGATDVPVNTMVTGTFNKDINVVTISDLTAYLLDDAGDKVAGTLSYNNRVMKFMPLTNLAVNKTYTFVITKDVMATDGSKLKEESRTSFTTGTGTGLQVTINPPDGTTNVVVNPTITATFNEEMNLSTVGSNNIYLVDENGTLVPGTIQYDSTHTIVSFKPTAYLLPYSEYTFVVKKDVTSVTWDQLPADEHSTFMTGPEDNMNLEVSVVPEDGATDVPINTMIVATFNKEMDTATLNSGNVYLLDANGTHIPGDIYFNHDNTVMTYILKENLEPNSVYTFVIEKDVMATDGDQLDSDSETTFTTGTRTELQVYVEPTDGATDVPVNTNILGIFNEEINTSTLDGTTVYLKKNDGTPVAGTIGYVDDADSRHIMTFNPTVDLDGNTTYVFTITQGVVSTIGDTLVSDSVTHFTTGEGNYAPVMKAAIISLAPTSVTVDTNESEVLGSLLGGLLGIQAEVDAAGVQGLAEIDLTMGDFLPALAEATGAASVEELMNSDISLEKLLEVISTQMGTLDAEQSKAVIDKLLAQVNTEGLGGTSVPLSDLLQFPLDTLPLSIDDLLNLGSYPASQLNTLSVLSGLNQALQPLIGEPIALPLAIEGLTSSDSGLWLQVTTPPSVALMEEGDSMHSSETRLMLKLSLLGDLFSSLGLGDGGLLNLPLYLELGSAEVNLTKLSEDNITVSVRNGLARLYIGDINSSIFFTQERLAPDDFGSVDLLNVLGLVKITAKGYAVGDADTQELSFLPVNAEQVASSFAPAGADVGSLLRSLVQHLQLDVDLLGIKLPLGEILNGILTPLLDILVPILDPLLNSVSDLLGTYAGRADVTLQSIVFEGQ